jgi:hypothetical protein
MNTKKWKSFAAAFAVLLLGSSCQEWGEWDPEAGNQTYPTLASVAAYDFEEELDPIVYKLYANADGETPAIAADAEKGNVLSLNNGYVKLNNPLNEVTCQNAVSMTFWVKQPIVTTTDADGNEVTQAQDLKSALIAFENENATSRWAFTANGWIDYDGMDGSWEDNNPSTYATGYITPGEWHYVALVISNTGYSLYVDGQSKSVKTIPTSTFDCSKMVQFLNNVSTLYIGDNKNDAAPVMIDDLKIYRNTITSKEIARPTLSGGTSGDSSSFEYIIGDFIQTVGAEDNSAGWWSEFSNYYRIPKNSTFHIEFTNYTNGNGNWYNYLVVVTTDADRNDTDNGYSEYVVLRSDAYGWGNSYEAATKTFEGFDWDTFESTDAPGAHVAVDVEYSGTTVTLKTVMTSTAGKVMKQTVVMKNINVDVIRTFFTVEGAHITIDKSSATIKENVDITVDPVGAEDNSAGWWSAFSDYFQIPEDATLHLQFTNYTNGGGNWYNYLAVVTTDADRNDTDNGYSEFIVLRSDAYGWGNLYESSTKTFEGFDWDTYESTDAPGSNVVVTVQRDGTTVTLKTVMTSTAGKVMTQTVVMKNISDKVIRTFLTVEGAHLKMDAANCYLTKKVIN